MADRGNLLTRNYSIGDTYETKSSKDFILEEEERVGSEEEGSEHLYVVLFEEVNHLRRHTRYYMKKLGGLKEIPTLLRRKASKKVPSYIEDLILVGNLEELVYLSIQEIFQPLDQLVPDSPIFQSSL